jgi:hypothetical protein
MDIVQRITNTVQAGTVIPKPEATECFLVKGWGSRRGETALVHSIPNKRGGRRYEKGVTIAELQDAYAELCKNGQFTRIWFASALPECAKEGSCNFTTIGGLFVIIGEAIYLKRGTYLKV